MRLGWSDYHLGFSSDIFRVLRSGVLSLHRRCTYTPLVSLKRKAHGQGRPSSRLPKFSGPPAVFILWGPLGDLAERFACPSTAYRPSCNKCRDLEQPKKVRTRSIPVELAPRCLKPERDRQAPQERAASVSSVSSELVWRDEPSVAPVQFY
jgi:hypothetical protein